jgi:dCMP deaminase
MGIKHVVYEQSYGMDVMTSKLFAEAEVDLRQHVLPPKFGC